MAYKPALNNVRRVAAAMNWDMPYFIDKTRDGYLTWKNISAQTANQIRQQTGIRVKINDYHRLWIPSSNEPFIWMPTSDQEKEEIRDWLLDECTLELKHNNTDEIIDKVKKSNLKKLRKDQTLSFLMDIALSELNVAGVLTPDIVQAEANLSQQAHDWIDNNIDFKKDNASTISFKFCTAKIKPDVREEILFLLSNAGYGIQTWGRIVLSPDPKHNFFWKSKIKELIILPTSAEATFKRKSIANKLTITKGSNSKILRFGEPSYNLDIGAIDITPPLSPDDDWKLMYSLMHTPLSIHQSKKDFLASGNLKYLVRRKFDCLFLKRVWFDDGQFSEEEIEEIRSDTNLPD